SGQPLVGLDGLEAEAALVAQPAPVDRVDVDAVDPQDAVAGAVDGGAAAHGAAGAGRLDLDQVPRAGLEPVRARRQGADRADLHRVAAVVRGEGVVREGVDLGLVAPV